MENEHDREEMIRARAHALWISEGEPEGQEQRHWDQASREVSDEQGLEQEQGFAPGEPSDDDLATETDAAADGDEAK